MDYSKAELLKDVQTIKNIPAIANLLEVICSSTKMGFAAVARVTEDYWLACAVKDHIQFGLKPGEELKIETTICNEIRSSEQIVVIDNVAEDKNFKNHHKQLLYGFKSYISVPIKLKTGYFFGTLCAIDPNPHQLHTPETLGMFKLFAELIAFHLDAIEELKQTEIKLNEERQIAELREEFIAILGHDLRNPIGAISNAAQLLLRMPLDERTLKLVNIVQNASYRTRGLIENMLDFASGKMGGGINLNKADEGLEALLAGVINELKIIWPEKVIQVEIDIKEMVHCDGKRIAQLFSNLLGNALTHGEKNSPVFVKAKSVNQEFQLSVSNYGKAIPAEIVEKLFQPFSRGQVKAGQEGLGLGLYIASEIAQAHKGKLQVNSTDVVTSFTLTMPN